MKAFYKNNPVKIDIAGSVESISKINRDILYKCYNTFYHPSNMVILVVGDVDPQKVFEQVEAGIKDVKALPEIKRIFPDEPESVNRIMSEQTLAVSMPMFQMGFKDNRLDTKGEDCLKHEIAIKLLLEMIMGRSSQFYNQLYTEGLLNSSFEFDYTIEESYAFSIFGGESSDPLKVKDRLADTLTDFIKTGLTRKAMKE